MGCGLKTKVKIGGTAEEDKRGEAERARADQIEPPGKATSEITEAVSEGGGEDAWLDVRKEEEVCNTLIMAVRASYHVMRSQHFSHFTNLIENF